MNSKLLSPPWATLLAIFLTLTALSCADYPQGAEDSDRTIQPDITFEAAEDEVLTVAADNGVLAKIEEADPATWSVTSTGTLATTGPLDCEDCAKGSVAMDADGGFSYTPAADFEGNDYLYITVACDTGGEGKYIILFEVAGSNDPPSPQDDTAGTDEDTAVTLTPLENDTDIDLDDTFALVSVGDPANGAATADFETGAVTYTPAANFNGEDEFTYVIADAAGEETAATVTITVAPVNDAPSAGADTYAGDEDTPLAVDADRGVLRNDSDIEDDATALSANAGTIATAQGGSIEMAADGSFTYTPASDFNGTDTFTYILNDTQGATAEASVTIAVASINDAPVAGEDNFTTDEDAPLTVAAAQGVLVNDSDPENQAISVLAGDHLATSGGGSVNLAADGGFTYTPSNNFNGSDRFTYTLIDASGGRATGRVNLSVSPVNDAPVAHNDNSEQNRIQTDEQITIRVLDNDNDIDDDPLRISQTESTEKADVSVNADQSAIIYAPKGNFFGEDSFRYRITDGTAASNWATVTVYYDNQRPTAIDDFYPQNATPILEDSEAITLPVLSNDSDPDLNPNGTRQDLIIDSVSAVSDYADVGIDESQKNVIYQPLGNYSWLAGQTYYVDTFTYQMEDNEGGSDTAVVTVTISRATALEPTVLSAPKQYVSNEDEELNVGANSGVLADAGSVWSVSTTDAVETLFGGSATVSGGGAFTYTPPPNFSGTDSFGFTAEGDEPPAAGRTLVTVTPINDAPLAQADIYTLGGGNLAVTASQGLLHNDLDLEGDGLTITAVDESGLSGILDWQADGAFTYTGAPAADETFTYTVSDGSDTASAKATLAIGASVPFAAAAGFSTDEDSPLSESIDTGGASASAETISRFGGSVIMGAGGDFSYTPPPNFSGTDSFAYRLTDLGITANGLVQITVDASADAPLAGDDFYTAGRDIPLTISIADGVLANDIDPDGDALSVTTTGAQTTDQGGEVEIFADGHIFYSPPAGFTGTDRFDYTVQDGKGNGAAATVIITVTP